MYKASLKCVDFLFVVLHSHISLFWYLLYGLTNSLYLARAPVFLPGSVAFQHIEIMHIITGLSKPWALLVVIVPFLNVLSVGAAQHTAGQCIRYILSDQRKVLRWISNVGTVVDKVSELICANR